MIGTGVGCSVVDGAGVGAGVGSDVAGAGVGLEVGLEVGLDVEHVAIGTSGMLSGTPAPKYLKT